MAEDIIKARIVFDTGGLGGVIGGGGSGGGSKGGGGIAGALGGAAGKGGAGGMMAAGAVAGAVAAGITALIAVVKKMFTAIKNASPRLQQDLKIMTKALQLTLRPIGDILSMFLRPFVIAWLKWAIGFYRGWKALLGKDKGEGAEGSAAKGLVTDDVQDQIDLRDTIDANAEAFGGLNNIMNLGIDIWNVLKGSLEGVWGIIKIVALGFWEVGKALLWVIDWALTPFMPILNFIGDAFLAVGAFINDVADALWLLSSGESWEAFKEAWGEAWTKLTQNFTKAADEMFNKFLALTKKPAEWTKTMIDNVKLKWDEGWETVKTGVTEAFTAIGDYIKGWFSGVVGILAGLWAMMFQRSGSGSGGGGSDSVEDAIITPQGKVIKTDPSDYIIATKRPGELGRGGGSVTVNVNALDASSITPNVLNMITNAVAEAMEGGLSIRTTEARGI